MSRVLRGTLPLAMPPIASLPVPIYHTTAEIRSSVSQVFLDAHRYNTLAEEFSQRYGRRPTHIIRAPGRVNIIGEHIDYALFGVLPAAIENDLIIAIARNEAPAVTIDNVESKYTKASFEAESNAGVWDLPIDADLHWSGYVKAGYLGALERLFSQGGEERPKGFDALVSSSIPTGAGVSSSAALIVASTLAALTANDKLGSVTRGDLVQMSVGNERKVGVNSGGMDQSASILSNSGAALYISFYPSLNADPTPFPYTTPPSVFVVANSLVISNKAETGKFRYNLRVVETLVGARVLAKVLGLAIDPTRRRTYREVLGEWWTTLGNVDDEASLKGAILNLLESGHLERLKGKEQEDVTLDEMVERTSLTREEFYDIFLSWVTVEATHFKLYKRAKHVFTEALRVLEFRDTCLAAAQIAEMSEIITQATLRMLGQLMNDSQESCKTLYECSCPELDQLTALARESGAYGSRLTGAGWGGCTVSLLNEADVPSFVDKLRKEYPPYRSLSDEQFAAAVFATKPGEGAFVFKIGDDK